MDKNDLLKKWTDFFRGDETFSQLVDEALSGEDDGSSLQKYMDKKLEEFKDTLNLQEKIAFEEIMERGKNINSLLN